MYRWGGDEFFVIMVSLDAEMARIRMGNLEKRLTNIYIDGVDQQLTIGVSFGFTNFKDASDLEPAVKTADQEMYRNKQSRKKLNQPALRLTSQPPESRSSINL